MIFNVQKLLSARYAPEAGGQTTPLLSEEAANKAPAPGRVHILADSTADLPDGIAAQVRVVPLSVRFGEEEFLDGIDIDHRRFYEKLVESDVLPTTSQATPGDFAAPFQAVRDAGAEGVVITLASGLSGTYESACLAARDFPEIFVVDSGTVAVGGGILVERALSLARAGLSGREIARQLEAEKRDIRIVALVDTLEYLRRGGRISKTAALAGGLLNIKPVLSLRDGKIEILGRARGSRQGNNLLCQEIARAGGVDFSRPVLLGYTGLSDALLQKYIDDSRALFLGHEAAIRQTSIGSVVGTHAGPGAVAVAFFSGGET